MDTQKFIDLSPDKRVEIVNSLLKNHQSNHMQNVAKELGMSPSSFSKLMRHNNGYQYNQTTKRYDKLLTIDEYNRLNSKPKEQDYDEAIQFIAKHLGDLEKVLKLRTEQLYLEPEIYASNTKTITRTLQVNANIYEQFSKLHSTKFPHLRLREMYSKCLLDFINNYRD